MSALQVFLMIDMFIIGIAATIAAQYAYTHYIHKKHPEKDHASLKDSPLPPGLKEQLLKDARKNFQDALAAGADSLRHDLKATSDRINLHLEELGNDIIHQEVERYRQQLNQLYGGAEKDIKAAATGVKDLLEDQRHRLEMLGGQAGTVISEANEDIDSYKQELKTKLDTLYERADTAISDANSEIIEHTKILKEQLAKDMDSEKQLLLERFETRLSDAVASFLMETLQHNVDLGAQAKYLTSVLDEHKDELLQGVRDEAKAS